MNTKRNRFLAALLAVVTVISMLPMLAFAAEEYLTVSTTEELQSFAADVNGGNSYEGKTVVLTGDISLGGEASPWTAIGTSSAPFKGTFDGGDHIISGLYIDSTKSYQGLFGYVNGGTVQNVTVQGSVTSKGGNIAGVAGYNNKGTIKNCSSAVEVSCTGGSFVHYYGGITSYNSGTVTGCVNSGNVTATGGAACGGIIGCNFGGTVTDCYNKGTVTDPGSHVGGIVGQGRNGSAVANCYNIGSVTGKTNFGAIVGQAQDGAASCKNSYYLTDSASFGIGSLLNTDGIMTEEAMKAQDFADKLGDVFMSDKDVINDGYPVLVWEPSVSTDKPVRPSFTESTELSGALAGYIREAVNSTKSHKLSSPGTLLGNADYMEGASSTDTDWMALAMGRFGIFEVGDGSYSFRIDDGDGYASYLGAMKSYIEKKYRENDGILHSAKATEWHRAAVTVAALGGDPTNFGTYNGKPIDLIADGSYNCALRGGAGTQGINGWIWGLIALDAGCYDVPEDAKYTREDFITEILKMQLTDGTGGNEYGGWVLGGYGSRSDVDITAMALQALAPYYNDDTVYTYTNEISKKTVSKTVRRCVDEALERLSAMMSGNGGFTSWGTNNAESIAQVIVALCSLGINPAEDTRFITASGKTLLDGLLEFRTPDGGFCHVIGGGWNSMATDQATYALVSYWRLENGMRSLYDMRSDLTADAATAVKTAVGKIGQLPEPSSGNYKSALKSALDAFRTVPESERRYVRNYAQLAAAIELVGGEAELDTDVPYITAISVTQKPVKVKYYDGENFDPAGMTITAIYSDGKREAVSGYSYAPAGALTFSDTKVYITYGILKTSLDITVTEKMPWNGEGDNLEIGTAEELIAFAERVNKGERFTGKTVALTAHIDLSHTDNWIPIGISNNYSFDGIFDGRNYAVDNLYSVNGGLFGYVGPNAVIQNVGVATGKIGKAENYINFLGGIANWSNGADFIGCWNGADIYCAGYSGGIVGTVRDGGESLIKDCYNVGTIYGKDTHVGGIVGHLDTTREQERTEVYVTVEACYNIGTVYASGSAGGIAGGIQDGHTVRGCYNAGDVYASSGSLPIAGSIVGSVTRANTFEKCYYDVSTCEKGIGELDSEEIIGMTADEMHSPDFAKLLGGNFREDPYGLANGGYPIFNWQRTYDADDINEVIGKINFIGTVTLDSADAVNAARNAYDDLDDSLKPYVSNYSVLEQAEAELAAMQTLRQVKDTAKAQLESYKNFEAYRGAQQEELKQIIVDGKNSIENAGDEESVLRVLAQLKADMDAVKTDKQLADEEAVEAAYRLIAAIGTVTPDSADAVSAARNAYNNLDDSLKPYVSNYSVLEKAEAELAMVQILEQAKKVSDLISAIGTVTLESESAIISARSAYDLLPDDAKAFVEGLNVLVSAEKTLEDLKIGGNTPVVYDTGDINGDGKINSKDLTRLMKLISGAEVEVFGNPDITGDGVTNSKDLTRLMKLISGALSA